MLNRARITQMSPAIAGRLSQMVNRTASPMSRIAQEIEGIAPGQTNSALRNAMAEKSNLLDLADKAREDKDYDLANKFTAQAGHTVPQYEVAQQLLSRVGNSTDGTASNLLERRMNEGKMPVPPNLEGRQYSPIMLDEELASELPVTFEAMEPGHLGDLDERIQDAEYGIESGFDDTEDTAMLPALRKTLKMGQDNTGFFVYGVDPDLKGGRRDAAVAGSLSYPYYRTQQGKDVYDLPGNMMKMVDAGVGSAILDRMQGGRNRNVMQAGAAKAYLANKNPGEWFETGEVVHPGQYLSHPKVASQIESIARQVVPIPQGILKNEGLVSRSRPVSIANQQPMFTGRTPGGVNTSATSNPSVDRWDAMAASYDRDYDPMNQQYM